MQGEILLHIHELRPLRVKSVHVSGEGIAVSPIIHSKAIVITPDCDLLSDYSARDSHSSEAPQIQARLLEHIQLCDVFLEREIRPNRNLNASLWKRIRGNQDERYHTFPSVDEPDSEGTSHPEYFLDFKRMFTMPNELLYGLLKSGKTQRLGTVPPVWIHQLIQRYFAFHSRVGVPDPVDDYR